MTDVTVTMKNTEFDLTRRQCKKTLKSYKVHSIEGAQFRVDNLNRWVILLMLHY